MILHLSILSAWSIVFLVLLLLNRNPYDGMKVSDFLLFGLWLFGMFTMEVVFK